jgi:hypothetical protein
MHPNMAKHLHSEGILLLNNKAKLKVFNYNILF